MAEFTAAPTASWVSLVTGARDVNLQNQGSCQFRYATHTTTPTTHIGMILKPGQVHPVKIATGENLYIRALDPTTDARAVAIDVPSA